VQQHVFLFFATFAVVTPSISILQLSCTVLQPGSQLARTTVTVTEPLQLWQVGTGAVLDPQVAVVLGEMFAELKMCLTAFPGSREGKSANAASHFVLRNCHTEV